MAIQTFTAGQVLTAAQMTALQANDYNQTVSAKTASYTLVAADKGTRITMSNASATTITVNTSLFAAGDSLRIQNIGAGICTITAGTATVTSAGPLDLVQWAGGQLYFTSASAAVWFPDAVTATPSGLVFITGTTFSAAATVSLPASTFTSTYTNYRIVFVATAFSAAATMALRMRASGADNTTANYEYSIVGYDIASTLNGAQGSGNTSAVQILPGQTTGCSLSMDIYNPQATELTRMVFTGFGKSTGSGNSSPQMGGASFVLTTSFDSLSFISTSNMTGRYAVYGYSNS